MKYLSYLFWGYAVVWILLFLYLSSLAAKQARLAREVEALKNTLKKGAT